MPLLYAIARTTQRVSYNTRIKRVKETHAQAEIVSTCVAKIGIQFFEQVRKGLLETLKVASTRHVGKVGLDDSHCNVLQVGGVDQVGDDEDFEAIDGIDA